MILVLEAIDPEGNTREFSCELPTLEASFDFLSGIVAKGHALMKAYVRDEHQRYSLPLEAFDGELLSANIYTLQEEWQAILTLDYHQDQLREDQVLLARHRVRQCKVLIEHHKQMINWASGMLQQKTFKAKFANYYEAQLTYHRNQLAQAQFRSGVRKDRLKQLTGTA